jgi:trehalose 6-phosphate synthase
MQFIALHKNKSQIVPGPKDNMNWPWINPTTALLQKWNQMEPGEYMVGSTGEDDGCDLIEQILQTRSLVIASNRGPVSFSQDENGDLQSKRGKGGLVTALTGLANLTDAHWIASAQTEQDRKWDHGPVPLDGSDKIINVQFVSPDASAYEKYYNGIANSLLWFLQHSLMDISHTPTIDRTTWQDWKDGYTVVNQLFAEAIARQVRLSKRPALVMLQDYHLYLAPAFLRKLLPSRSRYTLMHFIHIPWPGSEDWGLLPSKMRLAILDGLCSVDLLGFQTREDGFNFMRTCESYLPRAYVKFKRGRIWYRNHMTYVRDFPISIDVHAIQQLADSPEVAELRRSFEESYAGRQLIVRIDRIEPSKNIVRGFQAFDELLELHPEHQGKVQFLALLVPSRMEVEKYQAYVEELMGAAGKINVKYSQSGWEPVRILVGEDYPRAVAAMELYDVLLVNSLADGMNLVAKEGPVVNRRSGVLILSERTGAHQQLEPGALLIPPLDIYATAEALHQALTMPQQERQERSERLCHLVEQEDIVDWLCKQLEAIAEIDL